MLGKQLNFAQNWTPRRLWVLLFFFIVIVEQARTETLRHLFLVYRHGDRAPISLYKTDPNSADFWKEGLGQLTNKGKMQHYELGSYLRDRYKDFLTDNIQEVYVQSSAVERCLESAASNLASLYKPNGFWVWNQNLSWQPVPIHSMPLEIDPMLTTDSNCPEYNKELDRIKSGEEAQSFLKKYKDLFIILQNYTGQKVDGWDDANHVHDALFIEKLYNLTIPDWVEPIWKNLSIVSDFSFYIPFSTPLTHRLRGGPLVGDIVSKMEKKATENSTIPTKFNVYSTHDNVVAAFLSALGVYNNIAPPYFATVLIELHENGPRNHTVRVYYRNDTNQEPYRLTIPSCEFDCPLGHFVRLTKDVVPINWKEECGLKDGNQNPSTASTFGMLSLNIWLFCYLALTYWLF